MDRHHPVLRRPNGVNRKRRSPPSRVYLLAPYVLRALWTTSANADPVADLPPASPVNQDVAAFDKASTDLQSQIDFLSNNLLLDHYDNGAWNGKRMWLDVTVDNGRLSRIKVTSTNSAGQTKKLVAEMTRWGLRDRRIRQFRVWFDMADGRAKDGAISAGACTAVLGVTLDTLPDKAATQEPDRALLDKIAQRAVQACPPRDDLGPLSGKLVKDWKPQVYVVRASPGALGDRTDCPSRTKCAGADQLPSKYTPEVARIHPSNLECVGTCQTTAEVAKVVARKNSAMQRCFEDGLRADPAAGGKVTVKFTVGTTGLVTDATVSGAASPWGECILGKFKAIRGLPLVDSSESYKWTYVFATN